MKCKECVHYKLCRDLFCQVDTLTDDDKKCDYYEPTRPHGEWINKDYGIGKCWATCSECGESANGEAQDHGFGYDYSFPKICPNCGADMKKEDNEK